MKRHLLLLALLAITISSCAKPQEPETEVLINTTLGDIRIKLYNDTPEHRLNFVRLVEQSYYDSLLFHRVISGFMVQTGDPESKDAKRTNVLGSGGPGYTVPAEIVFPQHYHKYGALAAARQADAVNPERKSSGSQFYIVTGKKYKELDMQTLNGQLQEAQRQQIFDNLCNQNVAQILKLQDADDNDGLLELQHRLIAQTDSIIKKDGQLSYSKQMIKDYTTIGGTPFLDTQYTVFGEVIEGMEIVEKIQKANTDANDRPIKDIRILHMEVVK